MCFKAFCDNILCSQPFLYFFSTNQVLSHKMLCSNRSVTSFLLYVQTKFCAVTVPTFSFPFFQQLFVKILEWMAGLMGDVVFDDNNNFLK